MVKIFYIIAMNYTLTQTASLITECKDTSERIDLYLPYVNRNIYTL